MKRRTRTKGYTGTTSVMGPERDREALALARMYLLQRRAQGVTEELLQHYTDPPRRDLTPRTMRQVFQRLLLSARNRNMMATVITEAAVISLCPVLSGFDPRAVVERFASPDELLDTIVREVGPAGKIRRTRTALWPLFSRAVLSGARFLNQFPDVSAFLSWVQAFDDDSRKRAALPLLLSQEVEGFGFALASDFLKELGFFNFAKPDVHIKAIVKGLGLSTGPASDYQTAKAIARIAAHCGATSYGVDKTFWLVGSGRFYNHPSIGRNGRVATDRDEFIRWAAGILRTTA